ncbi:MULTISPECIES: hypothetical protein [Actinokineospora]|nr:MULTISPECIES: hypothetical protein [Actinokineospora]
MTPLAQKADLVDELSRALVSAEFGPFYATPGAVVSPLYAPLSAGPGVFTVAREDNAIGIAAGAALTGHSPVVLMPNHGLGPSLGAIASLIVPYRVPILLAVSVGADAEEARLLSRITRPMLDGLGLETIEFDPARSVVEQVNRARDAVRDLRVPTALLIPSAAPGRRA